MNPALRTLLDHHDGVIPTKVARATVPTHVIDYARRANHVHSPFPGVLVDSGPRFEGLLHFRAALAYAGPGSALSHTSALTVWRLLPPQDSVHILTERRLRSNGLHIHRRSDFQHQVLHRKGLPVTRLEVSLVDSWTILDRPDATECVITAAARNLTTTARIRSAVDRSNLRGRSALLTLVDKIDVGCRSQLELWGYDEVFSGPEFASFRWQVPLTIGNRHVIMDLYDPVTRVNVELDGAAHHSSTSDRERDIRRDALLATQGILTVRFSGRRLRTDPQGAREEVLTIRKARALDRSPEFPAS